MWLCQIVGGGRKEPSWLQPLGPIVPLWGWTDGLMRWSTKDLGAPPRELRLAHGWLVLSHVYLCFVFFFVCFVCLFFSLIPWWEKIVLPVSEWCEPIHWKWENLPVAIARILLACLCGYCLYNFSVYKMFDCHNNAMHKRGHFSTLLFLLLSYSFCLLFWDFSWALVTIMGCQDKFIFTTR